MAKSLPLGVSLVFEYFGSLRDRRRDRTKFHELNHVIVMALCGVIAGADGWKSLAAFARAKEKWFGEFLDLRRGTPSEDTFRRVFSRLDPKAFGDCLQRWVQSVAEGFRGEVVAIDGKSLRGAFEKAGSTTPLHLLHVWATEQRLLLAQRRVAGAPGEIDGVVQLLKLLNLEGAIVTLDANGCTPGICKAILESAAAYLIAAKGNRAALHQFAQDTFKQAKQRQFAGTQVHRSSNRGHGRRERRVVRTIELREIPDPIAERWPGLRTIAMVERTRTVNGKESTEVHFYISSLGPDPERIADAIRSHWGIENNLHWTLDVVFGEDRQRIREKTSAENFAVMNRLALMMLKSERTERKTSLAMKRRMAAWSDDYLLRVITSGISIP